MTASTPVAPLSSPLITRRKDGVLTATDANGDLVLEGRSGDHALVCVTAGGQWQVHASVKTEAGRHNLITDAGDREFARVEHHTFKRWRVVLPDGGSIPVSKGRIRLNYSSGFGRFGSARAPYLRPGRYIRFRFSDELLARPDRDGVAVALIWAGRIMITNAIEAGQTSNIG